MAENAKKVILKSENKNYLLEENNILLNIILYNILLNAISGKNAFLKQNLIFEPKIENFSKNFIFEPKIQNFSKNIIFEPKIQKYPSNYS